MEEQNQVENANNPRQVRSQIDRGFLKGLQLNILFLAIAGKGAYA